jgi:hypothetical protein
MDTWYALREHDTLQIEQGDTVAAGDVIATGSGSSTIIAYAAPLRLPVEAAEGAIARCDGIAYTAGDSLGERRVGLRTQKITAPVSGVARGLPHSGALAIKRTTADHEIRARFGGTGRAISHRAIIVTSAVARCGYAFADEIGDTPPLHIEPALLDAAVTDGGIPQAPHTATMVIAHIAEVAHLTSVSRSLHGTLIVGSVTEPVASVLLDRQQKFESRRSNGPGIVVLDGVGGVQAGARAVAPFRHFHGAHAMLDRFTRTITIIPSGDRLPERVTDLFTSHNTSTEQRDPAHYGMACTVQSAPYIAVIGSGERALCVDSGESSQHAPPIPVQNLQRTDCAEG